MTRRSATRGLRTIEVDLPDRREFSRRYLEECPHGGLLVDLVEALEDDELVELDVRFLDSQTRHRIRGVVLFCRTGGSTGRRAGVGFLPTETAVREALLTAPVPPAPVSIEELTRKQRRFATTLKVTYQTASDFVVDYTRNISTGGIFIDSKRPPDLGEKILFRLFPPGQADPIDLPGEVAWRLPGQGFGVQFAAADHATLERLSSLVRQLSVGAPEQARAPVVEEITS